MCSILSNIKNGQKSLKIHTILLQPAEKELLLRTNQHSFDLGDWNKTYIQGWILHFGQGTGGSSE